MENQASGSNAMRSVSPSTGVIKRERSDDEEEGARRVSQRTDDNNTVADAKEEVKAYVKTLSQTNDEETVNKTMGELVDALHNEGVRNEKTQKVFLQMGGPMVVVGAMNKYLDRKLISCRGINALMNATCDNDEAKAVVADCDGIETILAAMKRHPTQERIQLYGLKALNNLSQLRANSKLLVTKLDGVSVLIKAMNTFSGNAEVLRKASKVLRKLCQPEELRENMFDDNVVSVLATAVQRHRDDKELREYSREIMNLLV